MKSSKVKTKRLSGWYECKCNTSVGKAERAVIKAAQMWQAYWGTEPGNYSSDYCNRLAKTVDRLNKLKESRHDK